ncbi:MAG: hypothetical protein ACJAZ2_000971 [Glaciecola sp.]|jgi:hypothetical protein
MEYNTTLPEIVVPEYGRNIQRMINFACRVEDRDERNLIARSIVKVMGQVNSQYKDSEDFVQKQWDHLFIISDFKLDVDSPYPIPEKEQLQKRPKRLEYPKQRIKYRHYGHSVEQFIQKASIMDEGEEKDAFTYYIANVMKKNYLMFNRETVSDELIIKQLGELSEGKLTLNDEFQLKSSGDLAPVAARPTNFPKKKKNKKNYRKKH